MRFLGTGAGEGTPNPFCTCEICENARRVGGKEIRSRSSFRLDAETIIDIGADFFMQATQLKETFDSLRHVFYTHTHFDHFNYTMMWERLVKRGGCTEPLTIYVTDSAYDVVDKFFRASAFTKDSWKSYINPEQTQFVRLEFLKQYQIGNYRVTPLRGDHQTSLEENSANYLFENEEMSLYYALDSGPFLKETFDYLSGKRLDYFIGECTFPVLDKDYMPDIHGHMDTNACLLNLDRLYQRNAIDEHTKVYLTHIGPVGATHAQLEAYIAAKNLPYSITVAYDGLEL